MLLSIKIKRKLIRLSHNYLLRTYDILQDRLICGISFEKCYPPTYEGSTISEATSYLTLDEIFNGSTFTKDDNFMDIGCAHGRVFAYLLKKKFPGEISGIEINHDLVLLARQWTKNYDQISVIEGNALNYCFNDYNVFFISRPFEPEFFYQFIENFEKGLTHPITFYYLFDEMSGNYLDGRPGWVLSKRKWFFRKYCFFLTFMPERYSIWTFTPPEK